MKWLHTVYLKHQDFWSCNQKQGDSWHWKQILKIRDMLRPGFQGDQWSLDSNGIYTISSGYKLLTGPYTPFPLYKVVWNRINVPKHRFIWWLVAQGKLLTLDKVRWLPITNYCCLCYVAAESKEHLFFECSWSRDLLQVCCDWIGINFIHYKFANWSSWITYAFKNKVRKGCVAAMVAAVVYAIWK
ncbi:MAG: hypothetical protein Q8736_02555, partial [Sweet potato little leaf phytoplasma]|nr:hypothetical protein [Sweet potato little leaf phytoplasma]